MAEKTFTEKQREIVARKMGYDGPMQMFDEYLKSSPAEARRYALIGTKFMARGGAVKKYAVGGAVAPSFSDAQVASYLSSNNITSPEGIAQAQAIFGVSDAQIAAAQGLISAGDPSIAQAGAAYNAAVAANPNAAAENAAFIASQQAALAAGQPTYAQTVSGATPTTTPTTTTAAGGGALPPTRDVTSPQFTPPAFQDAQVASYLKTNNLTTPEQINQAKAIFSISDEQIARAQQLISANDPSVDQVTAEYNRQVAANPQLAADNQRALEQRMAALGIKPIVPLKPIVPATPTAPTTGTGTTSTDRSGPPPAMPQASTVQASLTQEQAGQMVGTELAPTLAATATPAQTGEAATVATPTITPTATMQAATAAPQVQAATAGIQAAQGTVAPQAQVQAAQVTPTSTAVGQLQAAQGLTTQVTGAPVRGEQVGEMVSGPAVNMAQVEQTLERAEAAQGVVTEDMTIQGQLAKLTAGFESGNPPAWAAASLRNATAQMAARGLGASSLAGQAIIQATLEAALPIASADAQVFQQMGLQNLSNRQQIAVLTAQQRAQFLGQEFDQTFQTRVINATRVAEIANMNFTAQQQIALENARLAQTMDLANLTNRQAVVMAEAAQIANLETANLNNRQQAAVINAQAFLQMDMANLQNEQQTEMFKAQSNIQSILTDQAAENAARQFNASSQNQADQFFANLTAQVGQFNSQQRNAMLQFNTDQANTVARFNAEVQNQRDQFNAQNRLVIDQSNAQWRREIATANTAAINRANEFNATKAQELTMVEYNNLWQQFRDEIEYSWKSAENAADRVNAITRAEISANASILASTMAKDAEITKTIGASAATILSGTSGAKVFGDLFNWGIDKGKELISWAGGLFDTGPELLAG